MKRKRPFKRNLILLGILFFLFVGLVVAVQLTRSDPIYFNFDAMMERNADRSNYDRNGILDIKTAITMLPEKPKPLIVGFEGRKEFPTPYKPLHGSMGAYLNVLRLDSDPLMKQYIEDCRPAIASAVAALNKPLLLAESPPLREWIYRNRGERVNVWEVLWPMHAAIRMDFLENNNPERGAEMLSSVIELQIMCEYDLTDYVGRFSRETLRLIEHLIVRAGTEENLDLLEGVVNLTAPAVLDTEVLLASWFNLQDNSTHYAASPEGQIKKFTVQQRVAVWQMDSAVKLLNENIEMIRTMSTLPASAQLDFFVENYTGNVDVEDIGVSSSPLERLSGFTKEMLIYETVVRTTAASIQKAHHIKLLLMIALQRYHNEHGVYPKTLDLLVPAFLETIPISPATDSKFLYEKTEWGYSISDKAYDQMRWRGGVVREATRYVFDPLFAPWPPVEEPVVIIDPAA